MMNLIEISQPKNWLGAKTGKKNLAGVYSNGVGTLVFCKENYLLLN
jgi:hypothetical protein